MVTKNIKLKNANGDYLYPYTENIPTASTSIAGKVQLDDTPTDSSNKALTSGGAKKALDNKLDKTGTAVKATSDASGNNIATTYATKTEVSSVETIANTAKSLAEGRARASSYPNYQELITALNAIQTKEDYKIGDIFYIQAPNVPDLWVYTVETSPATYSYVSDEEITTKLSTEGFIQVGYYKLSPTESQKVDLTGFVQSSRTINNKPLTDNISLTASDVGALASDGIATKATADAEGNDIASTYAKASEVISYEEMV